MSLKVLRMGSKKSKKRFIKNGNIFLEKLIGSWNGRCSPIRNFSAKELQKATNNYHLVNFIKGTTSLRWHYIWYKGSIEGRIVSVKKFSHQLESADDHIDRAINDIVTVAQMTAHNNILKLIGCCFETVIPIAVYDFAENGTLFDHIHTSPPQPLLWKSRLRIATEIASAVTYLHTASRRPIVHRNIKSSNVFLDRHNVAKLSNFEFSIAIPEGETHVVEEDELRHEYISPWYEHNSIVTEKYDVSSFGVLLMELLTGRKAYSEGISLATYFRNHVVLSDEDNQVLDPTILEEVGRIDVQQQVRAVSELALKCTEKDQEKRPTMLDVARQLLQLKRTIVDH